MVKLGKYNSLKVVKNVDFGVYLDGGNGVEILLPTRYVPSPLQPGDEIEVFIYRDNEGRLIATTEHPFAQVGEFAFLQVSDVNKHGAFLDWGLMKELLVPYSEQRVKLGRGMIVPVYVYVDDASQRIVASAKIEKYVGNTVPSYKLGDKVEALVLKRTEQGYKTIVDNLFFGMIYENELYFHPEVGERVTAYVKQVRGDGKIDLVLHGGNDGRIEALADVILSRLRNEPDGFIPLNDSSSPEAIRETFHCSKKDYKKAIGSLYRNHEVVIEEAGVRIVAK